MGRSGEDSGFAGNLSSLFGFFGTSVPGCDASTIFSLLYAGTYLMRPLRPVLLLLGISLFTTSVSDWRVSARETRPPTVREIVITQDTKLDQDVLLKARIVIKASHVSIDGNGATLQGPGEVGNPKSLEGAGAGIAPRATATSHFAMSRSGVSPRG